MKKVRIMSNLIADELKTALDESGIQLDEDVFEGQVSDIVEMISESVKKAANEGEDCENCDEEDDIDLDEGVEASGIYLVLNDATLGDVELAEDEFFEVDAIDADTDTAYISIYSSDGEVRDEGVEVPMLEIEPLINNEDIVEVDSEVLDVEESALNESVVFEAGKISFRGGKKHRLDAKYVKMREKLKKAGQTAKFMIKKVGNTYKKVAKTMKQKKAFKKAGMRLKKFAGKAKGLKRALRARRANAGSDSGSCVVKEGFDISVNGLKLSLEEGDVVDFENGKLTVIREGKVIFSDVEVSESFMDRCFEEAVLEKKCDEEDDEKEDNEKEDVEVEAGEEENPEDDDDEEEDDKDVEECGDKVEEGAILTFKSNKGFVLVSEGTELPMGNRIRARATLTSKGYRVTSEMLDNASHGKVVVL